MTAANNDAEPATPITADSHANNVAANNGMRVVVVGGSGVGKTTAARRIAFHLGHDHVELDRLIWAAHWQRRSTDAIEQELGHLHFQQAWILDGDFASGGLDGVCPQADLVVWLDYSRPVALRRILARSVKLLVRRKERWRGNRETLRHLLGKESIIRHVWCTHSATRRRYEAFIASDRWSSTRSLRFTTPSQFQRWLGATSSHKSPAICFEPRSSSSRDI